MAETTEDEREPEATDEERKPETTEDERKPEATEEERKPDSSEGEREPESSEGEQRREPSEDEPKREPKDLPEPEEKSADDLLGQQVVDPHGYTIGKIEALFLHGQDERASWARVKTGLVRTSSVFVPLHDAQEDGSKIRLVYEKEHVDAAPEIEPDGEELSDEEADVLHGYYGLERVKGLAETRDANPPTMKDPPWAVEKYPLPDMERPDEEDSSRSEGEDSSRAEGEDSSRSEGEDSSRAEGEDSSRSEGEDSSRAETSRQESSDEEPSGEDSEERD